MKRLIMEPEPIDDLRPTRAARLVARLESTGEHIVCSHQPLVDGARELIARDYNPATLLTMRHAGRGYDSFPPRPIGALARVSYSESEARALRRIPWQPRVAVPAEGQKSGIADLPATSLPAGLDTAFAAA